MLNSHSAARARKTDLATTSYEADGVEGLALWQAVSHKWFRNYQKTYCGGDRWKMYSDLYQKSGKKVEMVARSAPSR